MYLILYVVPVFVVNWSLFVFVLSVLTALPAVTIVQDIKPYEND